MHQCYVAFLEFHLRMCNSHGVKHSDAKISPATVSAGDGDDDKTAKSESSNQNAANSDLDQEEMEKTQVIHKLGNKRVSTVHDIHSLVSQVNKSKRSMAPAAKLKQCFSGEI